MDHSKRRSPSTHQRSPVIYSLIGAGIGISVSVLLILILPLAALRADDPNSLAFVMVCFACFAGSLVGTLVSLKVGAGKAYLQALITASFMIAPIILVSFAFSGKMNFIYLLAIFGTIFAAALTVAVWSVGMSRSNKRNMKKLMKRR